MLFLARARFYSGSDECTPILPPVWQTDFFIAEAQRRSDSQRSLRPQPNKSDAHRRRATVVSRRIALLRAHHPVRKDPWTHRYRLSVKGRVIVTALISVRNIGTEVLTKSDALGES